MCRVDRRFAWVSVATAATLVAVGPARVWAQSAETPVGLPAHETLEDPFNRSVLFDELELQSLVGFVYVNDNPQGVLDGIAGAFGISADEASMAPPCLVGTEDSIVESLEARRERWQMSYHVVEDSAIDTFAPIVARLAGK